MSSAKKSPAKSVKKTSTSKDTAKSPSAKSAPAKVAPPKVEAKKAKPVTTAEDIVFAKEYWTGDSRDGTLVNGEGYHYYRMTKSGKILEAFECYELEDGRECASPCPEMVNVHWTEDLGYEDFEILDFIKEFEFSRIKDIAAGIDPA